jgi:hypothetical protein
MTRPVPPIPARSSSSLGAQGSPAGSSSRSAGRRHFVTRAQLLDAAARGLGGSELARELRVSPSVVTRAKQREGILLVDKRVERARRTREWRGNIVMTTAREEATRVALAEGKGWADIGAMLGVSASTLQAWGRRRGLATSHTLSDDEWLALRDRRITARVAAHLAGSSVSAAHKAAKRLGFRWRLGARGYGRKPRDPAYADLAAMRAEGLTYEQIAARLGRKMSAVYKAATRRGLTGSYTQRERG